MARRESMGMMILIVLVVLSSSSKEEQERIQECDGVWGMMCRKATEREGACECCTSQSEMEMETHPANPRSPKPPGVDESTKHIRDTTMNSSAESSRL